MYATRSDSKPRASKATKATEKVSGERSNKAPKPQDTESTEFVFAVFKLKYFFILPTYFEIAGREIPQTKAQSVQSFPRNGG